MGRKLLIILAIVMTLFSIIMSKSSNANDNDDNTQTAHDFAFQKIEGGEMPLADFKNKVVLVVNTASHCGFTGQYEDLQKLYDKYHDKGLEIIAVPSNNFGAQEPGTAEEIKEFCETKFAVTFPLAEKEDVIGNEAHPFYLWAGEKLGFGTRPKWNFHKYLIDKNGELVDYFNSTTSPSADNVKAKIEELLSK